MLFNVRKISGITLIFLFCSATSWPTPPSTSECTEIIKLMAALKASIEQELENTITPDPLSADSAHTLEHKKIKLKQLLSLYASHNCGSKLKHRAVTQEHNTD